MAELTLTLGKALTIASNPDARPDVRVLGLLSAAAILIENHHAAFDPDVGSLLMELSERVTDSLAEAQADG